MASEDALYLVDGSGFIFRAFHALPPLRTTTGIPTGAAYGFTQMMIKLEVDHRPSHLVAVFDAGGRSQRTEMFADYKANRVEPPDDLKPQFALVRRVVDAFGVPRLEATDCEADDLIATIVKKARDAGMRVVIVSSDKDLMQLVDENVVLVDTMKQIANKDFVYGPAEVTEKFGVAPAQLGDVLALMGDHIDNIPGIPGVGPKTAAALIQYFGNLDNMLERSDEIAKIPGLRGAASVMAKVKAHLEPARLSRKLVQLDEQVPFDKSIEDFRRHEPDMRTVENLLRELEFERLIDRLKPLAGTRAPAPAPAPPPVETKVEAVQLGKLAAQIVTTRDALSRITTVLQQQKALGLSVQSSGGLPAHAALIGLAVAWADGAAYFPVGHRYLGVPAQLDVQTIAAALQPIFSSLPKFVQDGKDAEVVLSRHGLEIGPVAGDPALAAYLIEPAGAHDLKSLCSARLQASIEARADLLGSGKKALALESIELQRAAPFAACEAEAALHLGPRLLDELSARGMKKLNDEIELPLSHVLAKMERHGIRLDVAMLRKLGADMEEKLRAIEAEVRALVGYEVNLGSPKQLQELLFDKLGLPGVKRTKTGLSTDADVLEELAPLHPVANKILEHRVLAKLKGTYIDALPALVDAKSQRLHTSYQQTVAATGRLSSSDPNLQNVPIRTDLGKEIRRAFRAESDHLLVVGDYSQIELRILAHLSKDPVLSDAFQRDQDIHERTVIEMFGADKIHDRGLRSVAKMINYGIVYGLSDYGLAQRLGIDRKVARDYIDNYLRTYAGVNVYMNRLIADAHREGGSRTLLGRFRPLPELMSRNRNLRMAAERMARNTPIQGSAADLLKAAMIAVQRFLDDEFSDARMLLTVHDELVLEAPEPKAEAVGRRLVEVMETAWKLDVPLKVDLGIGRTWADAK